MQTANSKFTRSAILKTVSLTLIMVLLAVLSISAFTACAAEPTDQTAPKTQSAAVSTYDFEAIEYNHTPEFPCEADSTVIVYPDPVKPDNKALLVDSAGTAASANYYFADISKAFEVSVEVYVPTLYIWQVCLFPDQFDGRFQFAVTGDSDGNLYATSKNVSTYKAGEWFTVKIAADPEKETASVYINGTAIAENMAYYSSGVGYG